jgi:sulfatase modifying factor 1
MINMLDKNYILNGKLACVQTLIGSSLGVSYFKYQDSQSFATPRSEHEGVMINETELVHLIPFYYDKIKFNMIMCPADPEKKGNKEMPFMLGETEVTQELFQSVMGFNHSEYKGLKKPVESVTWYDCVEFCNRLSDYFGLGYYYKITNKELSQKYHLSIRNAKVEYIPNANGFRLPFQNERESAAKAGTKNEYPGAATKEELHRTAWIGGKETTPLANTQPVAQKLPNEWGFYDMSGNVMEWANDDLSEGYTEKVVKSGDVPKIVSGGSFTNDEWHQKSTSYHEGQKPNQPSQTIGFRVARTIIQSN